MPISYEIDTRLGLIRTTAMGVLTDADLVAHKRALASDPRIKPGMRELSDVRGVEQLEVTLAGIGTFVSMDAEPAAMPDDYRLAIVASTDVVFGMARLYQQRTDEELKRVGIFRTMEEAAAWLGLSAPAG